MKAPNPHTWVWRCYFRAILEWHLYQKGKAQPGERSWTDKRYCEALGEYFQAKQDLADQGTLYDPSEVDFAS